MKFGSRRNAPSEGGDCRMAGRIVLVLVVVLDFGFLIS
jgi:hypothetical protein